MGNRIGEKATQNRFSGPAPIEHSYWPFGPILLSLVRSGAAAYLAAASDIFSHAAVAAVATVADHQNKTNGEVASRKKKQNIKNDG